MGSGPEISVADPKRFDLDPSFYLDWNPDPKSFCKTYFINKNNSRAPRLFIFVVLAVTFSDPSDQVTPHWLKLAKLLIINAPSSLN